MSNHCGKCFGQGHKEENCSSKESLQDKEKRLRSYGRAFFPEEKREVVDRLLAAWEKVPALRLGQFLSSIDMDKCDLFYYEDRSLVEAAEKFASDHKMKEIKAK